LYIVLDLIEIQPKVEALSAAVTVVADENASMSDEIDVILDTHEALVAVLTEKLVEWRGFLSKSFI
jgi:hypothetical protein